MSGLDDILYISVSLSFLVRKVGVLVALISYLRCHISARYYCWWCRTDSAREGVCYVVAPPTVVTCPCFLLGGAQHSPKGKDWVLHGCVHHLAQVRHNVGAQVIC